jgi:hypothetical protein
VTQMINVSEKPLPGFVSGGAPKGMLIDGQWTQARSGETFETVNPATGSVIATVASGGPAASPMPSRPTPRNSPSLSPWTAAFRSP